MGSSSSSQLGCRVPQEILAGLVVSLTHTSLRRPRWGPSDLFSSGIWVQRKAAFSSGTLAGQTGHRRHKTGSAGWIDSKPDLRPGDHPWQAPVQDQVAAVHQWRTDAHTPHRDQHFLLRRVPIPGTCRDDAPTRPGSLAG